MFVKQLKLIKMLKQKVNVAIDSTSGHFVERLEKNLTNFEVIALENVKDGFVVNSGSKMTTKNHTDLITDNPCVIVTQKVRDLATGLKRNVVD